MNASRPIQVNLPRPIQVILFYVTAAVMPEDGTIRFAEDIYGHDAKLDRALAGRLLVHPYERRLQTARALRYTARGGDPVPARRVDLAI